MDIALLPNNINEYTASMFPMKFLSISQQGKRGQCRFGFNSRVFRLFKNCPLKEDFVNKIQEILAGDGFSVQHLHKLASEYTYKSRTDKMFELINTHLKRQINGGSFVKIKTDNRTNLP